MKSSPSGSHTRRAEAEVHAAEPGAHTCAMHAPPVHTCPLAHVAVA